METFTAPSGLEPLLSIDQLAEYLGVPVTTIYDWRVGGNGPRGVRIGRYIKFAVSDVREWVARQRESESSRSDAGSRSPLACTRRSLPSSSRTRRGRLHGGVEGRGLELSRGRGPSEILAAAQPGRAVTSTFPILEWCLEHGADGVTYVTRNTGCRITPVDYTVYECRDGVPVMVGYVELITYQYIGTAIDTTYWAHEITVSPAIMTGLAAEGLHVAGLPNCLTSPGNCSLYDYSFPTSVLETVGSEESGLAEWEWP